MRYQSAAVSLGMLVLSASLTACGGGGGDGGGASPPVTPSYTLGGTIHGLSGAGLIISDGVQPSPQTFEPQSVPADGTVDFSFGGPSATVAVGTAYAGAVQQQPLGNRCAVSNGTGTVSADVSDITITCVAPKVSMLVDPTDYAGATVTPNAFGANSVAVDPAGTVYVADSVTMTLLRITPAGSISPVTLTDATTGAVISQPGIQQIAIDSSGKLYAAAIPPGSTGAVIQAISSAGVVATVAGSGTLGSADGTGGAASFSDWVKGLAVDSSGNIYVADYGRGSVPNNLIRKVTPTGIVSTLAGSGAQGPADGGGTAASFNLGGADGNIIAVDSNDNVYVVEWLNEDVRKVTPDGTVSTLAGGNGRFGGADGPGSTVASFANPHGIATDGSGNIYILDGSGSIRMIMPNAAVSTLVSANNAIYDASNNVVTTDASSLTSIASSPDGTLYTAGADDVSAGFSADIHKITFQ